MYQLQFLQKEIKEKVLQAYNNKGNKQGDDIFVFILKFANEQYNQYTKKDYLGYGFQYTVKQQIHPILYSFVRLQISEMELYYRYKNTIQFHMNNPLEFIQKIYLVKELKFDKEQFNCLQICCQKYKFTLENICAQIKAKSKRLEKFNDKIFKFIRSFLLKLYLSILRAINNPEASQLCLSFSLNPKNIVFDDFYRLMLANPFYGAEYPVPILAFQNNKKEKFIKRSFLRQFLSLLNKIIQSSEQSLANAIKNDNLSYAIFNRNQDFFKIKDEIQLIEEIIKKHVNLQTQFPDKEILIYLREAQEKISENQGSIAKFQSDRLKINIENLKQISKHYP